MNIFDDHKFRASTAHNLMSKSGKVTLDNKAFLQEAFIKKVFGREKRINSKYFDKGNYAEEDSINLFCEVMGEFYTKNEQGFENDYTTGTPDLIGDDEIIDVKSVWDIFTFAQKTEVEAAYFWQLQIYMWLTSKQRARLAYALVNTPEFLIANEKSKSLYQFGGDTLSKEWVEEEDRIDRYMRYDDISPELRLRVFDVPRDDEAIEQLKVRIIEARVYLNNYAWVLDKK